MLKIDDAVLHTAMTEVLSQNIDNFNAGTNGAIALSTQNIMGDAEDFSFLKEIGNLVARRDISSNATATVKSVDSIDEHNIRVYFSTGSIEFKLVDAVRYGSDAGAFSYAIGEQIAKGLIAFMLNTGLTATVGAMTSNAKVQVGKGTTDISYSVLNDGLAKFGDASANVVAWVMNGKGYHDLVGDAITGGFAVDSVTGTAIASGTTHSLGRPVFVSDSVALTATAGSYVLGLTSDALRLVETKARTMFSEIVGGQENLKFRIQCESDVLLRVKGYSYIGADTNPDDTKLADKANWKQVVTSEKNTAGVLINVK